MAHEQVSIGGGNTGAHGRPLDLEEMSEVEGEVDVGKDKLCELDKELSGWLGVGREMFQGREAMDKNPVHCSMGVQRWFTRRPEIKLIPWPLKSPDFECCRAYVG